MQLPDIPGPDAVLGYNTETGQCFDLPAITAGKVLRGKVDYCFYLGLHWPNELGEEPDDLIGRNVKCGDNYYRIIKRNGERYSCEPIKP